MTDDKPSYGRGKNPNSRKGQIKKGERRPGAGRPSGSPNRNSIIRKVLGQVIADDVGGKTRKMAVSEASLLKLAQQALAGDLKAIKMVLELWKDSEEGIARERETQYAFTDADRPVIEEMYRRMKAVEGT
jgi:hypothetical protein